MPPAQAILHISAICFVGASLFAVVEWFKPYRPSPSFSNAQSSPQA
jgi:hypothetical protein